MKSKNIVLLTASLALGVCLLPLEGQASKTGGEKEEMEKKMGGSSITRKTPPKSEKKSGKTRKAIIKRHELRSGKGEKSNVRKTKRQETSLRRDKNVEQVNKAPAPTSHNAKRATPDEILQILGQQGAIVRALSGETKKLGLPTGLGREKLLRLLGNKTTKKVTLVGVEQIVETYTYEAEIDGYKAAFKLNPAAADSLAQALKEQGKSVFAVIYDTIYRDGRTEVPGATKHVDDVVYLVVSQDKDGTLSYVKNMGGSDLKIQVSYYLKDKKTNTTTTLQNVQF